jgi:DNA-binding NtrC family response regulator
MPSLDRGTNIAVVLYRADTICGQFERRRERCDGGSIMRSIGEMTGPFLRAFAEICHARTVGIRVVWCGGDEPVLLVDERYAPEDSARVEIPYRTRQIPILFGSRAAGGVIAATGGFAADDGSHLHEASIECEREWRGSVETVPITFSDTWRLSIERGTQSCRISGEVHGFRIIIRIMLPDRAMLHGRLERAGVLFDLFRAVLDSHGPPCRTVQSCGHSVVQLSPPLLGESPRIRELRDAIRTVADSAVPLLIEGESGTGKEVLARNAHSLGRRRNRPLVILNCLEVPRSLMQSELFGHLKGSFTGASRDRAGLIESACGGTLFLDEIGEMPRSLQAAFLRVLQEREVRRIGESRRRAVDVRFVFATNSGLDELVERGRFRLDLFYRMCGVRLHIPPLRARRGDIPVLAGHFLGIASGERGGKPPRVTAKAMNRLMSHDWPGNVRELKHEMERALALYPGTSYIRAEMLSPRIRDGEMTGPSPGRETIQLAVRRLETGMIEEALDRFDDNRTRTAAHLGITRQGLLKKMKRYGISPHRREEE